MKRWIVSALITSLTVVITCGCNPKPNPVKQDEHSVSSEEVRGWARVGPYDKELESDWVANYYPTVDKGISSELMDAIARPDLSDAKWRTNSSLREDLKNEIKAWKKSERNSERNINEVASNFVLVINGKILSSNISVADGNWNLAFEEGLQAFELAWQGIKTAPELMGVDYLLNLWMAADHLAQLSKNENLTQAHRKKIIERLETARKHIPYTMSDIVRKDFQLMSVGTLAEIINKGADARVIGAFIAPLDDPDVRTEKLTAYFNSLSNPLEPEKTVKELAQSLELVNDSSHGAMQFLPEVGGVWEEANKKWGVDFFNSSAESWDMSAANKSADNAVGEMIKTEILRKYVSATESGYTSQINFSAAIIRTGYEWFKIENKRNPKDLRELNMAIGTQVIDPASGKAFVIDWQNSMLKSEADPLAKELVLLNAIIQNGVPF
ncbi:MAG: hypothetical protein KF836_02365 [Fimbriimonadaceae bacterium]|nr:hypothetical protein [Fimbriimonadaceae bacterium]